MPDHRKLIQTKADFATLRTRLEKPRRRIRKLHLQGFRPLWTVAAKIILGPQRKHSIGVTHPDDPAFDCAKAELLAKAAQLAYTLRMRKVPRQLKRQAGFRVPRSGYRPFNDKVVSTQAFVAVGEELVMLVFRGTEPLSLLDWALDFEVMPKAVELPIAPGQRVHVHHGFYHGVDVVWEGPDGIVEHLRKVLGEFPDRPLYIGGHSLGGALAVMAAARLPDDLRSRLRGVYTAGQPRVGLEDFADAYEQALGDITWRLVNLNDLGPRVPFEALDFRHAGHKVPCAIGPDVMLHLPFRCPTLKAVHNLVYRILPDDVDDHFPEAYVLAARGGDLKPEPARVEP